MSVVWSPPGNYRDGVQKIIDFPNGQSPEFTNLLAQSTIEDLEDALKVLEKSDNATIRRSKVKTELGMRKKPPGHKSQSRWSKWFEKEWNDVRRAAGKKI